MPLTDVKIRNAKPAATIQKLSDGEGLQLWIMPSGGKSWNLAYRFAGKQKKLHLGTYPDLSLQDAREKAREARKGLANDIDPSQQKQRVKANRAITEANTFAVIAAELIEQKRVSGKAAPTLQKIEWLTKQVNAEIGTRPIASITPGDVLAVLRKPEKAGSLEKARKMRAWIGEVFRYAIATDRATIDPTYSLRGALAKPVEKHRAAFTTGKEFGGLLRAIESFRGQPTTIAALKLMALLFPRPGELRQAEWKDIDLEAAIWTIPAHRAKMREPHAMPLPRQAIAILKELHSITGGGELVFPGYGKGSNAGLPVKPRPISENAINGALRRMGITGDEATAHGFRASASTLLNESGKWHPDAVERALAHRERNKIRAAYARGQFWDERVKMAQWWADECDRMREGGKVIKLQARHP